MLHTTAVPGAAREDRRIPSLDGLRAISIAMVLVAHLGGTRNAPFMLPIGELGVRTFFVISGYLITTLLLGEHERHGRISLPRFYLRRTFRIFPAYYVYLIVVFAAAAAGWLSLQRGDAVHAVTYTTNYHVHRSWWIGHAWSLGVEEQFYVLWPAVLTMLGPRRGLVAAAGFVVLAPVLRVADWFAMPQLHAMQGESFWTIGDAVAIGCVLAMVRPRLTASDRWIAFQQSRGFWLVPVCAVASYFVALRFTLPSLVVLQTVTIACIAACVDHAIRFPSTVAGRVLNWSPVAAIGALSYSLYLWQQPFLNRHGSGWLEAFPVNLALALAAAVLSYRLVERPMLRCRAWIERGHDRRIALTAVHQLSS